MKLQERFFTQLEQGFINDMDVLGDLLRWLNGDERVEVYNLYVDYEQDEVSDSVDAESRIREQAEDFGLCDLWITRIYKHLSNDSFNQFIEEFVNDWDVII